MVIPNESSVYDGRVSLVKLVQQNIFTCHVRIYDLLGYELLPLNVPLLLKKPAPITDGV